ncbi:MAG: PIN domain-containing protein [Chloroflexi bacterium]|nr:PIN domain-containing protein [Chloroflexota bacterium]
MAQSVFFDASVLVAASKSPSGGSAVSLELCQGRRFRMVVTERVLLEARTNIEEKFGDEELVRFYRRLADAKPRVIGPPSRESVAVCDHVTAPKDVHVLAAAVECKAAYLLTLDRKHLLTPKVLRVGFPFRTMTPGEFLQAAVAERSEE